MSRFEEISLLSDRSEKSVASSERRSFSRLERNQMLIAEAVQRAKAEIGHHRSPEVRSFKIRGRAGELIACESRSGSIDINTLMRNHPVYDLYDSKHAYSVKTRLNKPDGSIPVANYAHDLRVMIGVVCPTRNGRYAGMRGVDLAAERLITLRTEQPETWYRICKSIPAEIAQAEDTKAMASVMIDKSILLIPADHVAAVRDYIERAAQQHPERYGLSSDLSSDQLASAAQELSRRVQPIARGVTSEMIEQFVSKAVKPQRRFYANA